MAEKKYNGKVKVQYIDMDDDIIDQFEKVASYIDDPMVPLPIVTVDEKLMFTGPISFYNIFEEVNRILLR